MSDKIIRDSLHGYISLPAVVFSEIIDTPIFQRLKRIEQTSMRPVYPSARHDRFIHSLGVYYLGKKALYCLIRNIEQDLYRDTKGTWEEYGLLFGLACLLHDCAHAPFSHSFEDAYMGKRESGKWNSVKIALTDSISLMDRLEFEPISNSALDQYKSDIEILLPKEIGKKQQASPHEVFSAIVVARHFRDGIKKVYETVYPLQKISAEQIAFIQRAILGMKYDIGKIEEGERTKYNILNCLIELLNSKSFDVDKLDYIMRDSVASGVENLAVDIERLLSALTIIEMHDYDMPIEIDSTINNSIVLHGNLSINDHPDGNNEIYLQFKNIRVDGEFVGHITKIDGDVQVTYPGNRTSSPMAESLDMSMKTTIKGTINDGTLKGYFQGSLTSLNENYDSIDGLLKSTVNGKIKGRVIGSIPWKDQGLTLYRIGYKKSALSVIEDTITARNRLYMWIYAHHKVTYIDYLLRNAVLLHFVDEKERVNLSLQNFIEPAHRKLEELLSLDIFEQETVNYLLDDNRLITQILDDMIKSKNDYARNYFSRKKVYTVWKTYAEYNLFFCDLTAPEKERLYKLIFHKEGTVDNYKEGDTQIFPNSILKEFERNNEEKFKFVWIHPSGYKLAQTKAEDTYLIINQSVRRLKDVIIRDKTIEEYVDEKSFFYLYASMEIDEMAKLRLIDFLKSKARE